MSAVNDLEVGEIRCVSCNTVQRATVQFAYGSYNCIDYKMGDEILWGGSVEGMRAKHVKAQGIILPCPNCGQGIIGNGNELFELDIVDNEIKSARLASKRFKRRILDVGVPYLIVE